jgi:hypothetical protein
LFAESLQSKVEEYEKLEKSRSDRSNKDKDLRKKIETLEKEQSKSKKVVDAL